MFSKINLKSVKTEDKEHQIALTDPKIIIIINNFVGHNN